MIDFFQTLNVKRFVFADGDNVNNPKVFIDFLNEKKLLELDTQIICFIDANTNQNTWYNTAVKYIQSLNQKTSFNLTPIRILTEGSNALDMVLSSYVGLAMGQNSRAEFIIVSNDKGYESVVEHFGSLGVKINRLSINNTKQTEKTTPAKTNKSENKSNSLNQKIVNEIVDSLLKSDKKKRPKKKTTLKNVIQNNFREKIAKENCQAYVDAVLNFLKENNKLNLDNQSLNWK